MHFFKLILRNTLRHKLRTALTLLGLVVAILAFGLLSTVVDAWYSGVEGASSTRLITRNSISLVFPLPLTYAQKIRQVEGVRAVASVNWFGGVYKDPKNFFPQLAVDAPYFAMFPEFIIDDDQMRAWVRDRKGAVVGKKLAETYGFKIGDTVVLKGTIFPGNWEFVIRGIYTGKTAKTEVSQFFFHWEYLNETMKRNVPRRANQVGLYMVELSNPSRAAEASREIDAEFKNSLAETLTETEKAFELGFVAMTESIVVAIRAVSFLVIFIILAVMANTMAMTARERTAEYATLKALGFAPSFVVTLIFGESILLAVVGGAIGVALTFPVADVFGTAMGSLFPNFNVSTHTLVMQTVSAIAVGIIAALAPSRYAARVNIVDGLRSIG